MPASDEVSYKTKTRFSRFTAVFPLPFGTPAVALSATGDVGAQFFPANCCYPRSWWGNSSI